jgi:steroid delta-isomerase-like uncharacterized protein
MMDATDMERLVRRLHHIWNTGDLELIAEVYAPEVVVHWPRGFAENESRGRDGVRRTIERVRSAFPDWHEAVLDVVVGGDKVVTRYTSSGTHQGTYGGVEATGRRLELDEISIYRIEDGRVAEQWCLSDDVSTLVTLGLLDGPPDL